MVELSAQSSFASLVFRRSRSGVQPAYDAALGPVGRSAWAGFLAVGPPEQTVTVGYTSTGVCRLQCLKNVCRTLGWRDARRIEDFISSIDCFLV